MSGAKPKRLIADGEGDFLCRSDSNAPEELLKQLPRFGSESQIVLEGLELPPDRRACGRWLYFGTSCMARRFTASLVRTRPGRDDADFFMRALDYTSEQTTAYEALWDLDTRAGRYAKGVSGQDYIGIDSKKALGASNHDHLFGGPGRGALALGDQLMLDD